MSVTINLAQKVTQSLTIHQIQSLEILQLSNAELETYIYEKVNENPLLTMNEPDIKHMEHLLCYTTYDDRRSYLRQETNLDFIANQSESSYVYLLEQIPLRHKLSILDIRILKYLIYNLNEKYFLDVELTDVAALFQVKIERVECMLKLLQSFEPIGVGARNVQEYLLIQIAHDEKAPQLAQSFVENHLQDVTNLRVNKLAKHYQLSIDETKKIIQYICQLRLTPYVPQSQKEIVYQIPDVIVEKIRNEWLITIQHAFRPQIEINHEYLTLLKNLKEVSDYCKCCLNDALLLMRGIEQRDQTLYKVVTVLVKLQVNFFEHGIEALKPLKLKDVAEALSVHESTISRAIRQKYIRVSHGVYELQQLFVKGFPQQTGEEDSVMQIKKQLQQLIDEENKQKPLSDQQLMQLLECSGIQISRRTIAKYRQQLNIPSASKRSYLLKQ